MFSSCLCCFFRLSISVCPSLRVSAQAWPAPRTPARSSWFWSPRRRQRRPSCTSSAAAGAAPPRPDSSTTTQRRRPATPRAAPSPATCPGLRSCETWRRLSDTAAVAVAEGAMRQRLRRLRPRCVTATSFWCWIAGVVRQTSRCTAWWARGAACGSRRRRRAKVGRARPQMPPYVLGSVLGYGSSSRLHTVRHMVQHATTRIAGSVSG
jgi:hypothetical protein